MPEITLTVEHKVGLHARPASLFVQTAKKYTSTITITCGERSANAKSILNVLALGANKGAQIHIEAEGDDASEALAALEALVNGNFGEA
jgi:phosphocarrier protein HPr